MRTLKFAVVTAASICAVSLSACGGGTAAPAAAPSAAAPSMAPSMAPMAPSGSAMAAGGEFGAGCSAVPTDASNPGSFAAMAKEPVATKRLPARVGSLSIKPDRLAERIEQALTEPDARRALQVMTELQLETVRLAPSGPNTDRARSWLAAAVDVLGRRSQHD